MRHFFRPCLRKRPFFLWKCSGVWEDKKAAVRSLQGRWECIGNAWRGGRHEEDNVQVCGAKTIVFQSTWCWPG